MSYYIAVFERDNKKYAIKLPIQFNFHARGLIMQPIIHGTYEGMELDFVMVNDQREAAKCFQTSYRQIGRWIKNGNELLTQ